MASFNVSVIGVFCIILLGNGVEASHRVFRHLQFITTSSPKQLYRTSYHFQPPKNWINDPNGPMIYNGVYHLFYQYNPNGAVWGNIVWAHSISTDLINWLPLDPAIYPSHPFDINGCWSGSATILPGNKPAILYTGINPNNEQVQNIAFPKNLSDPFLREWIKPDYNPLMSPTPMNGVNSSSFRDPTTAWKGPDGHWRILVGSKRRRRGIAILYKSKDFKHWVKAQHPLHSSKNTGMWECPDFFPVSLAGKQGLDTSIIGSSVKHVLKVSLDDLKTEYYTVGRYVHDKDKYIPDKTSADDGSGLRFDYGKFYASKTFFDDYKKRRVLWGWINESDSVSDDIKKGWSGVQAIPRSVLLDNTGKQLILWPVDEIQALRKKPVHLENVELKAGSVIEVPGIRASQADVEVTFDLESLEMAETMDPNWVNPQILCSEMSASVKGGLGPFGLLVLASKNLEEHTAVFFRVFKSERQGKHTVLMCSDQSRSSLRTELDKTIYGGFVDVDLSDGKLSLRSLVDHSIVESFGGGGRTCITARVYPQLAVKNDAHLYVFNYGSEDVKISKLSAWNMRKARMN